MTKWIVGVDEVGRGALAGPVVVAAAAVPAGFKPHNRILGILKDSKKLSAKKREAWCAYWNEHQIVEFALARVYPRQIEKRNISKAANLAAARAFGRLTGIRNCRVFLDGGLFLGNGEQPTGAKTIVRGDEKINAVKIASVVAKVHRDRLMRRLAKRYPAYGFEIHKGYGTKAHRKAIQTHGPCPAHRLTFVAKSSIMDA
ncbi:MAG: ribonuclease HII [Minisyncoccia bacterium]|jgi:ribonuclease HII